MQGVMDYDGIAPKAMYMYMTQTVHNQCNKPTLRNAAELHVLVELNVPDGHL